MTQTVSLSITPRKCPAPESEKVTVAMTSPVNPAIFEPGDSGEGYKFVVMPMRL